MKKLNPTVLALECVLAGLIVFAMMYFWRKASLSSALLDCALTIAACGIGSWYRYKRQNQ